MKTPITPAGLAWIAEFETGGESYYNLRLKRPSWPGGASGVTIGIGYDLGYNTKDQIAADWAALAPSTVLALQSVAGIKGKAADSRADNLAGHPVTWEQALPVFELNTVPRFYAIMLGSFKGADLLPVTAQEALLSLVFNRGGSLTGSSRKEMAEIAKLVSYYGASSNKPRLLNLIADQIMLMRRLWVGRGLPGLLTRRASEAHRIRQAA